MYPIAFVSEVQHSCATDADHIEVMNKMLEVAEVVSTLDLFPDSDARKRIRAQIFK